MEKIVLGMLAHVDAGKTTLTEALLYKTNTIKKLGRVDKGDATLDTYALEKERGITIFSKEARIKTPEQIITILDTPGHVDFCTEAIRTLSVLDAAILIISGTDDITGHTKTLWQMLGKMKVPVIIFVNKMDMDCPARDVILKRLKSGLDNRLVDFTTYDNAFYESIAENDEKLFEQYMAGENVYDSDISELVMNRKVFPCLYGSALKMQGIDELLHVISTYVRVSQDDETFGAKVYKISRDENGNRVTHMKITGGSLSVRDVIDDEKVTQIRMYSGSRYDAVSSVTGGDICQVYGLNNTKAGMNLGNEKGETTPLITPALKYAIILPEGVDASKAYSLIKDLDEEEPALNITYNEELVEIELELMGQVQLEIIKNIIKERYDMDVSFGAGHIVYKETILDTVEGVGHFEPLRHYAEVHLVISPGDVGSGITFESQCSEDILDKNWQRLIKTHVFEREHRGVLTGSPLTDVHITLVSGKAHNKHTEGGDFRQATYRAIRQGLMQAESMLLEPYYDFTLTVNNSSVGRAITDIEGMCGTYTIAETTPDYTVITGSAPVYTMCDYQKEVISYTKGFGNLSLSLSGYGACHNPIEVIDRIGYNPLADKKGESGSVFCKGGAGYNVPWDQVFDYMHMPLTLNDGNHSERENIAVNKAPYEEITIGTDEIDAIINKTFYSNKRNDNTRKGYTKYKAIMETGSYKPVLASNLPKYMLVDGYNLIFAIDELNDLAKTNVDAARDKLKDMLCNYQGMKHMNVIVVFDAYRVKGHPVSIEEYHNIKVVYTKEAQTADAYIEKFTHEFKGRYDITVVTSDGLEQVIIRGAGCKLISSREFKALMDDVNKEIGGTTSLW